MPITIAEQLDSREWQGPEQIRHYIVLGTDDASAAKAALLASAPSSVEGLVRDEHPDVRPQLADEGAATGIWDCRVRYAPAPFVVLPRNSVRLDVDFSPQTEHVLYSKETVARYPADTAPNFNRLVNVSGNEVKGVDVPTKAVTFRVMKVFSPADAPNFSTLWDLQCTTNDAPVTFTDSITGKSLTLAAGEGLFLGTQAGATREDGLMEIVFNFVGSPNVANLSLAGITGIAKKGHEYLWAYFEEEEDDEASVLVKTPLGVYPERMFDAGDWDDLNI